MNKIIKNVLAVASATLMAASAFALIAIGVDALKKEDTVINAYEIAQQNGFEGTEEEWLASLRGVNGEDAEQISINDVYEEAQKNGYTGTFLDFLKEYLSVEMQDNHNTEMIAKNALSVVSINCSFKKNVIVNGGGWWGGTTTQEKLYTAAGSGVIIDLNKEAGNAYIVTNYHVIYDSESLTANKISDEIYLYTYGAFNGFSKQTGKDEGGDGIKATYVGGAMDYDIALLKVEGSEILRGSEVTEAKIGDSQDVQVGENVFAIGNPDGAGISVTNGLISVDSEYISMGSTDGANRAVSYRVMRTDAAINPGNSGGALFNADGELIGITNAKSVENGVDNMCYALPITQVRYVWENILDNGGTLQRAMLGVVVQTTDSSAVYENGKVSIKESFLVASTDIEKTAAAYGKLKYGDIFQSITLHGKTIELDRRYYLNDLLLTVRKGDTVTLTVIRDGVETNVDIVYDQDGYFTQYN